MSGFRDIHAHFVYGVDDGAQTREDMEAMLDAAHRDGITTFFATPHMTPGVKPFPRERFDRHFEYACQYVRDRGYDMRLCAGAELLYTPAIARYAEEHTLQTMGDTENILIEYVPSTPFKELKASLELLERCGYLPILAHIERYQCMYHGNAYRVKDDFDVRFQVNCSTVLGKQGFFKDREIRNWFGDELIDYLGTDTHNCTSRPIKMRAAYDALCENYGEKYANRLAGVKKRREGDS